MAIGSRKSGGEMISNVERILVLAPHTDDGEFGCGASIKKFLEIGVEVYYAAFSLAEESVSPEWPRNILEKELREATKILGIPSDNILIHRYQVRNFAQHRQQILEDLVKINNTLKPNLVFMPCLHDLHQDHAIIASEGLRAFKKTSILAYELPWNNRNFTTQCFISVTEEYLNTKIRAMQCYESQKHRYYASAEFLRSLAITRGTQIGQPFAEAFEVIRWIV